MLTISWCNDDKSLMALTGLKVVKMLLIPEDIGNYYSEESWTSDDDDDFDDEVYGMNCQLQMAGVFDCRGSDSGGDSGNDDGSRNSSQFLGLTPDGQLQLTGQLSDDLQTNSFSINCNWQQGQLHGSYILSTVNNDQDEHLLSVDYINFHCGSPVGIGLHASTVIHLDEAVATHTYVSLKLYTAGAAVSPSISPSINLFSSSSITTVSNFLASCPDQKFEYSCERQLSTDMAMIQQFISDYHSLPGYLAITVVDDNNGTSNNNQVSSQTNSNETSGILMQ